MPAKNPIITAALNGFRTPRNSHESVTIQSYGAEHITVNAGSSDGLIELIKGYRSLKRKPILGPDHETYDAINKGIVIAKGDIIEILNADDFYAHEMAAGAT